jgi:hypothetical protein
MSNTHTRDVIALIADAPTQRGIPLRTAITIAHPSGPTLSYTDTIAAQFAAHVASTDSIRYVDVETKIAEDELTISGTIKILTDNLLIFGHFQTENNVFTTPGVSATARRRSDITAVEVSGASAPNSDTEPWPENVKVTVTGKDLNLVFPARPSRGDALGKLIPELLG